MKALTIGAEIFDLAIETFLFVYGIHEFYEGRIFEGCALFATCVLWQRAWKED